jgi:hypothetical protein
MAVGEQGTRTEKLTLHFDLSHCPPGAEYSLGALGETYPLTPHTAETRARHAEANRALAMMAPEQRERLTHFAEDVKMPATGVGMHAVTYPPQNPNDIRSLALPFIHVATAAKRRYFRTPPAPGSPEPQAASLAHFGVGTEGLADDDAVAVKLDATLLLSPVAAAKHLVFCHPDLTNLREDVAAAVVHGHIAAALTADPTLTDYISAHGPGTADAYTFTKTVVNPTTQAPYRPATEYEGKPILAKDGLPLTWPQDGQGNDVIQEHALSEGVLGPSGAAPTVRAVISSVNADPSLNGAQWTAQHGVTAVARKRVAGPSARRTGLLGVPAAAPSGGYNWTLTSLTSMYGVDVYGDTLAYDGDTLSFDVKNWANRFLGVSVQWYDEIGAPTGDLTQVSVLTPGNTLAGIPSWTLSTTLSMTMPDGAVKGQILLGGLGQGHWSADKDKLGTALTCAFNFGVPMFLLAATVGNIGLEGTMKTLALSVGAPAVTLLVEAGVTGEDFQFPEVLNLVSEAAVGMVLSTGMEKLAIYLTGAATAKEAAEAVPFIGWAIKLVDCATTLADLGATSGEVAQSPATYDIEVARVIDVTVDVSPDPTHGTAGQPPVWPEVGDHWEVKLQYRGGTTLKQAGTMDALKPDTVLSVPFSGDMAVAAGPGAQIQITASFYSASGWLCGKWTSGWIAAVGTGGSSQLTVTGAIVEYLVQLTAETQYGHYQKLAFQDGHHAWQRTTTPPAGVFSGTTDCGDTGNELCRLLGITTNDIRYALGYAYQASGQGLPLDFQSGAENVQMFAFQSISALGDPEAGMKQPTIGFSLPPSISYDQFGPAPLFSLPAATYGAALDGADGAPVPAAVATAFAQSSGAGGSAPVTAGNHTLPAGSVVTVKTESAEWYLGPSGAPLYDLRRVTDTIDVFAYPTPAFSPRNFYLDTRAGTAGDPFHLRQVALDGVSGTFDYTPGKSWGAFPPASLDALAVHPNGYMVGVDYENHKMLILQLPDAAADDAAAPTALPLSGPGLREGLMEGPVAVTITADGRILVLEQDNARIQAFDTMANPVQCFAGPLSFALDASLKADLDGNAPSLALQQAYQGNAQPQLIRNFGLPATMAAALDAGTVGDDLVQQFKANGLPLSDSGPHQVLTTLKDGIWLLDDQGDGVSYDIRADLAVSRLDQPLFDLPVTLAGDLDAMTVSPALIEWFEVGGVTLPAVSGLQLEVITPGAAWVLTDTTVTPHVAYGITTESDAYVYEASELLFMLPADVAGNLDPTDPLPQGLFDAFSAAGLTLSSSLQLTAVGTDGTDWQLLDTVSGVTYDIDSENDLDVFHAASLQVEVEVAGAHWILRDKTNTLTFDVTADPATGDLTARQLISTMALQDGTAPVNYLDIGVETKGFIYVLSYAGTGSVATDYHLDVYNPDGSWLTRTPKDEGSNGVNGARFVVDQWRNVYTLNYESMLGPGGRTEPTVSTWTPSTPPPSGAA